VALGGLLLCHLLASVPEIRHWRRLRAAGLELREPLLNHYRETERVTCLRSNLIFDIWSTFGFTAGCSIRYLLCFSKALPSVLASEVRDQKINSFLTFRRRVFQTKNREGPIICP